MSLATITSKGQTTIPKDIRDKLGLKAGDRVNFTLLRDGTVIMRTKAGKLTDLYGVLHDPNRPAIPVEDMNPWR